MTTVPECIYCKRSAIPFNREHVIPEAFGSYGSDTMVLNDAVCQECNSRLGAEIDQVLSRDSYEALIRANSLPQGRGTGERFQPRRAWGNLPDHESWGVVRGARFVIDWNTHRPKLLSQIIVRTREGVVHTFLAHEFPEIDNALLKDLPPGAVQIVGTDTAEVEQLMELVRNRGIQLRERETVSAPPAALQGEVRTVIEGRIDIKTWRAIAKIAFNYLAFHEGVEFVLSDRFDPIRNYITGVRTDRAMVRLLNAPILTEETYHWRAFDGHLVAYQTEGRSLRGKVSLYNSITYEVMLCGDLGLFLPLKNGHAFDPIGSRASPLASIPFGLLKPAEATRLLSFVSLNN